jgi:hypothetical protein
MAWRSASVARQDGPPLPLHPIMRGTLFIPGGFGNLAAWRVKAFTNHSRAEIFVVLSRQERNWWVGSDSDILTSKCVQAC